MDELTAIAMPLRSDVMLPTDGDVFGTVFVLVSLMWIFSMGIPKARLVTCRGNEYISEFSTLNIYSGTG